MSDDDTEEFEDCRVIKATPKAFLIKHDDLGEFWVPRSVVHENSEVFEDKGPNSFGKLVLPRWWCDKEGLT